MPSQPQPERRESPTQRKERGPPPTLIMQGYEKMGTTGRRRLMWIGLAMLVAGVGVGLFGASLSLYRFIFVVLVTLLGIGLIFPQYGIATLEVIVPAALAKLSPGKLLSRPDRRDEETPG